MNMTDSKTFNPHSVTAFAYVSYDFDATSGLLRCVYRLDDELFEERIRFLHDTADAALTPLRGVDDAATNAACRLVWLLAGVSYYKAAAPPIIEVPDPGLTPAERQLLQAVYTDGLGEFAFENDLDLSGIVWKAAERAPITNQIIPTTRRPLVPFGGGIDSIVTTEGIRELSDDLSLFVVSRESDRFEGIEAALAVAGLGVIRAERILDPKILESRQRGYLNGHVPVTGIISAIAVASALLTGHDSVAMSNEWSASSGNVERDGKMVNHQWSKSLDFEDLFRAALAESLPVSIEYFSWLRPASELWVAQRFAQLEQYHSTFRSCNRAFHINPDHRLDHWCGTCDKCAFVNLILSPYVSAETLRQVFQFNNPAGREPLENPDMLHTMRTLLGVTNDYKPFECVGDINECRVAAAVAATRTDRQSNDLVQQLGSEAQQLLAASLEDSTQHMLAALGPHRIPDHYVPTNFLD